MAAGAGSSSRDTPSPSLAEQGMVPTGYDSDTDQFYGYFSPRMLLAGFDAAYDSMDQYGYSDEDDNSYIDSCDEGGSHHESPPWEGGGYDCEFVFEVPNALQCLICTAVAREAQQVDCCGKVFCKRCLRKLKQGQGRKKPCPNCRKKKWKSFADKKSECAWLVLWPNPARLVYGPLLSC